MTIFFLWRKKEEKEEEAKIRARTRNKKERERERERERPLLPRKKSNYTQTENLSAHIP